MYTGTAYWANVGRKLFAVSEEAPSKPTSSGNATDPTMSTPCREVLRSGQEDAEVTRPLGGWEEQAVGQGKKWWKDHKSCPRNTLVGVIAPQPDTVPSV